MKTNPEIIPHKLYDWIDLYAFHELTPEMQAEVLQYFSMEEYNSFFDAAKLMRMSHAKKHETKENLLNYFDKQNQGGSARLKLNREILWKAASVSLLFSTALLSYLLLQSKDIVSPAALVRHDTVYIEKPAANNIATIPDVKESLVVKENKISETKKHFPKKNKERPLPEMYVNNENKRVSVPPPTPDPGIQVVSVDQMHKPGNSSKKNSMKDDSLERKFRFVSM